MLSLVASVYYYLDWLLGLVGWLSGLAVWLPRLVGWLSGLVVWSSRLVGWVFIVKLGVFCLKACGRNVSDLCLTTVSFAIMVVRFSIKATRFDINAFSC